MSKNTSTLKIVGVVFLKFFLILITPTVITFWAIFALVSFIIDAISKKDDSKHLSCSETRKRATDRTNARRHSYLDFLIDYFKVIIS